MDLSSGVVRREEVPEAVLKDYVGGRGFAAKYLYDEVRPGVAPLGPDNKLMLIAGPLAGSPAHSVSRWIAATKSPLTGTHCRSVGGADFGAWMRFTGLDFILIEGRAERPVYLYVQDGHCEIRDARDLWGQDVFEVQEALRSLHGAGTRVACIGPAGEKLVRFAGIFSDRRSASRGGVGAVMGSKNLKAVAIRPSRHVVHCDEAQFRRLVREQTRAFKAAPIFPMFSAAGTTFGVEAMNAMGIYPTRNFREGRLDGFTQVSADQYDKITEKHVGCHICMIRCGKMRRVPNGPYAGAVSEGPEYESIWAFTGSIDNSDIGSTVAADALCDRLGIDTVSAGNVIGFAYELFEKGILSARDTDGLELTYGNHASMLELIKKIGYREGIGDLLAEGVMRAAARIGRGAEAYAMHVKGLELPGYDPRGAKALGLGYATAARGGCHAYAYSDQELYNVPFPRLVDRFADEGKGDLVKFNQDQRTCWELGILCVFPVSLGMFPLELYGKMLVAATGIAEFGDVNYLVTVGERVNNLERLFNIREGFGRKEDTLPTRMTTEPLKKGASEGQVIRKLDTLLDEFYEARGWNREGAPTLETLSRLGLAWAKTG